MSAAQETVVKFPIKTKLVCSACGAPGEGSCRCGAAYVTPGERAEAAVKANPEKSDRAIAADLGVGSNTVRRARQKTTAPDGAVEKRTGRDGKKRKAPKRHDKADEVAALADAGATNSEIAKTTGISARQVRHVVEEEAIRREAGIEIDPATLPMSAQKKLEAALRQRQRKLDAEHATRMRGVDEEVRLRVVAENKEYVVMIGEMEAKVRSDEKLWREIINNHKPLFTVDQFKTILMCLHPDGHRTADKLAEAFRLFNGKKVQLTGGNAA